MEFSGNTVSSLKQMCEAWEYATIEPRSFEPVSSDIPMLLLSGQYDPVTPPANGDSCKAYRIQDILLCQE